MTAKLYLSAERVSREDEFEHHLQIARDRNLGIEIQELYLPELMWGNWKLRLEQYKHFKWNLDVGHVNAFAQNNSLAEWIDALHPHLGYMHVHNNHGEEDSHNPVLDGTIDYEQLFECLDKWQVAPIVATEIYGRGLTESIDYLEKKMADTRCYGDT